MEGADFHFFWIVWEIIFLNIYLFESEIERERGRKRESSTCCLTPQVAAVAGLNQVEASS